MYKKEYSIRKEHIDFQGIMDGLFYPFYFEECRHSYLKEVLEINIEEYAKQGLNLVLTEYSLKFKRSLKSEDVIMVTCEASPVEGSKTKFGFNQEISVGGKLAAEARFLATCVPTAGGRPYIPEALIKMFPTSDQTV